MSRSTRRIVALAGLGGVGALLLWALTGLPGFGHYPGPYGDILNATAGSARQVTDVVTAVNFDYRGVDTVGEEFILFTAAGGVAVLLRIQRREAEEQARDEAETRRAHAPTDAVRLMALALVGPTFVLGMYVVSHGTISPGGGFQGGVVLTTAFLLIYLAGHYLSMRRVSPVRVNEIVEALGAAGFVVVGIAGMLAGGAFLTDFLPLGTSGTMVSGGTMGLISFSIGMEVAAAFLLIVSEFLEQTVLVHGD